MNIPVIAFCNTDSPLKYIDIAIPCNTKATHSIGLMWWLLSREVLRLRGRISRKDEWNTVVDLFFYRDPDETEKEEAAAKEAVPAIKEDAHVQDVAEPENWEESAPAHKVAFVPADDWNDDEQTPAVPAKAATWGGGSGGF